MTEHAVDLKASLHAAGPEPSAQAHRQPVVGIGGRVQPVMVPERSGVSGRVFFRVRNRALPQPAGVPVGGLTPLGLEKALEQKRCSAPLGGRPIERSRPAVRLAGAGFPPGIHQRSCDRDPDRHHRDPPHFRRSHPHDLPLGPCSRRLPIRPCSRASIYYGARATTGKDQPRL